jgi:putative peptidoglycan lipid II flippase
MLKFIKNIYVQKQKTLYSSTVVVGLTLIIARLLGLLKLRVLTGFYSQQELDLFLAAFRLPDFIFEVFVAGSIASCFIPIVNDILEDNADNKKEAMIFSQSLSLIFMSFWLVFTIVMFFFAKPLIAVLAPGFNQAQIAEVAVMSTRILFFQVPFLLLGNIIGALLQSSRQFLIPGLAPVFYNLGIILGVIFWAKQYGLNGAVFGIVLGSFFYFLVLFIGLRYLGFSWQRKLALTSSRLKRFFKLFWPRFFTSATVQIDATVDLALSTLKGLGSYSSFYMARNLQILPVSLLGIAISQSALPFFSTLQHQGKQKELMQLFVRLVLQIIFVMLPFVIFFIALRIPLVRLFFGGQMFDWEATVNTAKVLSVFALSLPFHTIYYVITRVFFAIQDTRTPFIASLAFTILNSILSIVFIKFFELPIWYLALSFTISISANSIILMIILMKRLDHCNLFSLFYRIGMMFFIALATFSIVWTSKRLLDGLIFDTTRTLNLFLLTFTCVTIGLVVYFYLAWVFLPKILAETIGLFTRLSVIRKALLRYRKFLYTHKIIVTGQDHYEDKVIK